MQGRDVPTALKPTTAIFRDFFNGIVVVMDIEDEKMEIDANLQMKPCLDVMRLAIE